MLSSAFAFFRSEPLEKLPILAYHRIADSGPVRLKEYRVSVQAFDAQVSYLREQGYYSVDLFEWSLGKLTGKPASGRRPILITFDDGYRDFIDVAWPVLQRHGFSAMVFVVTDKVGSVADWDLHFGDPAPLLDWAQIRQLRCEGVRFGSHTATHQPLSQIPIRDAIQEATGSRTLLQQQLGEEIQAIAYPWGVSDERIRRELMTCGYKLGLRQLRREGVRFGSHTATHQPLSHIPIEDAIQEATWSRTLLQQQLGEEVRSIAYPWGVSDETV